MHKIAIIIFLWMKERKRENLIKIIIKFFQRLERQN